MRTPHRLKTLWSDLKTLAAEENLVWRQQIKKDRWGAPVTFEKFPNPPYHAVFVFDRSSYLIRKEIFETVGYMKLRRGWFWLCRS